MLEFIATWYNITNSIFPYGPELMQRQAREDTQIDRYIELNDKTCMAFPYTFSCQFIPSTHSSTSRSAYNHAF